MTPPLPPTALTGAASAISQTTATLSAGVNPNGAATTYHFDLGATSAYGASWPASDATVGSDSADHTVMTAVVGLTPGTTYHYRVVATNSTGVSYGTDQTFTTDISTPATPAPPTPPAPARLCRRSRARCLGRSATIATAAGSVTVKLPGTDTYIPLDRASTVPVGTTINASTGTVRLTNVRDRSGKLQTATFWGGAFVVHQARTKQTATDHRAQRAELHQSTTGRLRLHQGTAGPASLGARQSRALRHTRPLGRRHRARDDLVHAGELRRDAREGQPRSRLGARPGASPHGRDSRRSELPRAPAMTLRGRGRTPRRSHLAGLVVATLVTLALTGLASLSGMLGSLERASLSTRYSLRHVPRPTGIVVVKIDDESFDELATRWPFPRSFHARAIDKLHAAGAKEIVYDVQFTEPSADPKQDEALYRVDRESGRSDPGDERERRAGAHRCPRRRREPREGSRTRCCRQPRDRSRRRHHELPLRGIRPEEPRGRSRRTRARHRADPFTIRERQGADRLSGRRRRVSRSLVLARAPRHGAYRLVPRQDRRRRSNRAKPPRPARDTDERQRTHARPRSAGERDLDGSARQPAPRRARLADGASRSCSQHSSHRWRPGG